MLVIALAIAFIPNDLDARAMAVSGCRVIENTFNRSNGAVLVRETGGRLEGKGDTNETYSPTLATPPASRDFTAAGPTQL